MGDMLSVFVLGISFGLVLFLLASGLSLTMGLMRIVNMAHGALYMVAAYLGVWVVNHTHNWVAGVVAGAVCAGLIGLLIEMGFLRRLYKQEADQVLLTIGLIYIFTNAAQWIWGTYPLSSPVPGILSGSVPIGSINLPVFRFLIIGFGFLMAILLWVFQDKTKVGARVRAGMDNREVAGALGINLKLLFTGIFALGSLVAGLTGLFGGALTGINLSIGWDALLYSLIVVVIGGTGSIQGALLGGIVIGLLNSFGTAYFSRVSHFIIYAALIIILLIRPSGLLGRRMDTNRAVDNLEKGSGSRKGGSAGIRGGAGASSGAKRDVRARVHRWTPYVFILLVLGGVAPFVGSYTQSIMTKVLIFALFAMSLDIIMGFTGLISFGHAAFFAMAGYVVGITTVHYHVHSFWLVLPLSIVIAAALAAVIGYLSLRVRGTYFLLVTMAFGQLLYIVGTKWYSMTGGTDGLVGIKRPDLGFDIAWTTIKYYYFALILFVICYYLLYRITHSAYGKALVGIRENEGRMRSVGYNTWALKYVAIILAGAFAGVAGLLFAYFYGGMVPSYFALETSALPMLMVIMGGAATLWGPALGAVVIILVQQYAGIYLPDRWPLILGVIFVLCVMLLRGGFASYLPRFWARIVYGRSRDDRSEPVGEGLIPEKAQS